MNRILLFVAVIGLLCGDAFGEALPKLRVFLRATQVEYAVDRPILLRITIENIGGEAFRLDWHEEPFRHIELRVTDEVGDELLPSTTRSRWALANQDRNPPDDGPKRRIALRKGDRFSTTFDLGNWVRLPNKPQKIFVKGTFFPNPKFKRVVLVYPIEAVSVNLSPALGQVDSDAPKPKDDRTTNETLSVHGLVNKHLQSQMKEDWGSYFSTIHLQSYLSNSYASTEFHERFKTAKNKERLQTLQDFEAFVVRSLDYRITRFEFLETLIEADQRATVEVLLTTRTRMQSPRMRFNPRTGQVEETWKNEAEYTLRERKVVRFTLMKNGLGSWKIVQKDVNLVRASAGGSPPQSPTIQTKTELKSNLEYSFLPKVEALFFARGRATLNANALTTLRKVVDFLNIDLELFVVLEGHADSEGDDESNYALSLSRAKAAMNYLLSHGVGKERIQVQAHGEGKPLYKKDHPKYPENRRVEIRFER